MMSAKYCHNPPNPVPLGSITVHNTGLMYGHVCETGGDFLPVNGSGCGGLTIKYLSWQESGPNNISTYKLVIERDPPGGFIVALVSFSQPVTTTSVSITGDVSLLDTFCILSKYLLIYSVPCDCNKHIQPNNPPDQD